MAGTPFLSIVVPFHNSAETCRPLLDQLEQLDGSGEVELIFVDDGSDDATPRILREFARRSKAPVAIIEQSRAGPGAARNAGLDRATGKYIWFVDSDDVIDLAAVSIAKEAGWQDLDLVVWDWDHPRIAQRLAPGLHSTNDGPAPPDVLDPIVCNWFSHSFLERTRLRFPEFTFYEATPLEFFVLPLLVDHYLKVDFVAYRANVSTPSITRGADWSRAARFDCLHTIPLGMAFVAEARLDEGARSAFEAAFIRTFLWYVVSLSPLPGRSWLGALRVMRLYREQARALGVLRDPRPLYPGGHLSGLVMRFLWLASAAIPSQRSHFRRLRNRLWSRDIVWEPPQMPDRYRRMPGATLPRAEVDPGSNLEAPADP